MKRIYIAGLVELKNCTSLSDVANILGVEPRFLSKQIYHTADVVKYTTFEIPKKDGSKRIISSPNANLKFIQSRLSRLLYQCYFDIHGVPDFPNRVLSHGFQKRRNLSICTNAYRHTRKRHVFNTDIEGFFPALNFGRVRGYFIRNSHFTLNETVATVIAQTACYANSLPQGAPSSPIISELITQTLDYRLQGIAAANRCTYSRYADDITFSTNLSDFPQSLATQDVISLKWSAGADLRREVERAGFRLNDKKSRMQRQYQRQATTGLTVNEKVNISATYYKGVRFCAHAMMTKGKATTKATISVTERELTSHTIWGMLCHIHHVKSRSLEHKSIRAFKPSAPSYLYLMKDFYHYHRIHTAKKPLIVCEGKTDYIYIKEAIRWNADNPRIKKHLVSPSSFKDISSDKGDHWGVDFVNHSDMAGNLLDLAGGGGDLPKFANYHLERVTKLFSAKPLMPVIVIVDNDSQSVGMWSFIKKATGTTGKVDGSAAFYHVSRNLFIVPIPSAGGSDFYIEKLIPAHWLKEKLDGKKLKLFQKKDEKLEPDEYGKTDFANKVIRANRGKVDLSSFLPLLLTICDVIEHPQN